MRDVAAVLVLAQTNRDVAPHRTVFGLVAGIRRDVTPRAEVAVVGRTVVEVSVRPAPGKIAVVAPTVFGTDPAANLDAHVRARDVIEPHTVHAADPEYSTGFALTGRSAARALAIVNIPATEASNRLFPNCIPCLQESFLTTRFSARLERPCAAKCVIAAARSWSKPSTAQTKTTKCIC